MFRSQVFQRVIGPSSQSLTNHESTEIVGLFTSASGLGQSARLCADALKGASYRVQCRDAMRTLRKRPEVAYPLPEATPPAAPDLSIYHLNPPMLPPVIIREGLNRFRRKYNIAYWAWELDLLPKEWQRALRYMNAVLVPSRFTQSVISQYTDKPVLVVPHPVNVPTWQSGVRGLLGLSSEQFVASTIFSFGSSFGRKNPLGAVRAFKKAFQNVNDARLVIKATDGHLHRDRVTELNREIANDDRIMVIDGVWPAEKVYGLLAESDVYLSLHRAEGFGLTVAEAQLLGTPVISTDWSGTQDFAFDGTSYLVSCDLIPVRDPHPEYAPLKNAQWAHPNTEHAAQHLSTIYADRIGAREKALKAGQRTLDYLANNTYADALASLRETVSMPAFLEQAIPSLHGAERAQQKPR